MKTKITLFILLLSLIGFAQNGINYKAFIKDANGNILSGQPIGVQFEIREATANGSAVYTETHTPTTDANGIIVLNIGTGTTSDTFSTINWSSNAHWLNLQIDITGGTNYADISTTKFMAVPYAKYAQRAAIADNASTKIDDLSDAKSDGGTFIGSSIFLGRNAGQNDDGSDNRNVSIGFHTLSINSTGMDNIAIGHSALEFNTLGYSNVANGTNALRLNTIGYNNVATGNNALYFNSSGHSNVATGLAALYYNTTGYNNIAIGKRALFLNTTGNNNIANGIEALKLNTTGNSNVAVGSNALAKNTTASYNTANGNEALYSNTTGDDNTANGNEALYSNTTGDNNTANGHSTLFNNTTGGSNTANGFYALYSNTTGYRNVALGTLAGANNTSGSSNIFIGYNSGSNNTSTSNKLYINNETSDNPLIYGEFDTDLVRINGSLEVKDGSSSRFKVLKNGKIGINTGIPISMFEVVHANSLPTPTNKTNALSITNSNSNKSFQLATHNNGSLTLYSDGNYLGFFNNSSGVYTVISDRRIKKDITALEDGTLNKVMQLNPVSYLMKDQTDTKRNLGFISQEVQEVFPSLTHYVEESDLLTLSYTELIPILIKALQEQQNIIEAQNLNINTQNTKIDTSENKMKILSQRLESLEAINN